MPCFRSTFVSIMRIVLCTILSVIVFVVSFQNSLVLLDYKIHKEFYEAHCINQDLPEMQCHGKCQAKKQSEKSGAPVSVIKTGSFEFHFLPAVQISLAFMYDQPVGDRKLSYLGEHAVLKGFSETAPRPPEYRL